MFAASGRPVLKIGIDFGTTYSAVAHALRYPNDASLDKIPGCLPLISLRNVLFDGASQVRTQLAWHPGDQEWLWGNEVDEPIQDKDVLESSRITMIKLGLDMSDEMSDVKTRISNQLADLPADCNQPSVQDLITIYLNRLFSYAKTKIAQAYQRPGLFDVFETAYVECAICVPALWTQPMVQLMISAAENAGIPNPIPISEPEAAATFIRQEEMETSTQLEGGSAGPIGDTDPFLVVDAGGGTTDFITYDVEIHDGKYQMVEGVRGTGKFCGSALLDEDFRDDFATFQRNNMPDFLEDLAKPNTSEAQNEILKTAVEDFEKAKKRFNGSSTDPRRRKMIIHIPGIRERPGKGVGVGRIVVPTSRITKLFQKLLNIITETIKQQINAFNDTCYSRNGRRIQRIMFVGGLSGSPHVVNALKEVFDTEDSPIMGYRVRIVTPHEDSSTLISRGSILCAFHKDAIGERVLRCTYAFSWDEEYNPTVHTEDFDPAIHGGVDKVYDDPFLGYEIVQDRSRCLFRLDERVPNGDVRSFRGFRCASRRGDINISETLYSSVVASSDHLAIRDPQNGFKSLGSINFQISGHDRSGLPVRRNTKKNERFLWMEYEIRVIMDYPRLIYEIIIPRKGKFLQLPGEEAYGPDPIRKYSVLNCASAFDVTSQRALETSAPSRVRPSLGSSIENSVPSRPPTPSGVRPSLGSSIENSVPSRPPTPKTPITSSQRTPRGRKRNTMGYAHQKLNNKKIKNMKDIWTFE